MQDQPPAFDSVNVMELRSVDASKIIKVSVYTGLAEITRLFKFDVKMGQNQVKISGLPNVMGEETLRVEARGCASIQGVAIGSTPQPPAPTASEELKNLRKEKRLAESAIERCNASIGSIRSYVASTTAVNIPSANLGQLLQSCETEGARLDSQLLELEEKLSVITEAIEAEEKKLAGGNVEQDELGMTASIGLFAHEAGEIELTLIYAVRQANWSAGYDVRVNMHASDKPVVLLYKANITQSTGEAYVPLTLETVTPTYGADIPTLSSWYLSVWTPLMPELRNKKKKKASARFSSDDDLVMYTTGACAPLPMSSRGAFQAEIISQGTLSATYQVPGLISIPSDSQNHSVTIIELTLGAEMSWITVPKVDKRVHLKAKVKNASEYTLLPGEASIYVDGSFISKSNIPSVAPQGSFDCSLGIDPSIQVTYHPLIKNASRTGFYTKSSKHSYNQRVTIANTKTQPVGNLKVLDRIPISEDSQITVKLLNPSLSLPSISTSVGTISLPSISEDTASNKTKDDAERPLMPPVKVSSGVAAQWDGADDSQGDITALGKDGKLNWLCSIPPQGTVNLSLQWEVLAPASITVDSL
ncbi:hypothetical protein CCMSSC00406_0003435 [Pleurotus cornucopiae]|uniref:Uncharacterized protein n=1 Tax=Pleurotus cornucopiae TaxID=5321 RepID=A0ACB7J8Q3_PLECO|nr:hypothetical protein CCMSSC00406_0003435 [Pleurotus cornucopiae]